MDKVANHLQTILIEMGGRMKENQFSGQSKCFFFHLDFLRLYLLFFSRNGGLFSSDLAQNDYWQIDRIERTG